MTRSAKHLRHLAASGATSRAGISLLVVILLISIATVTSYAILRGQSMALHIQDNADLRATARDAAMTGLTYGMRAIHQGSWGGVGTSETRTLGDHQRFTVSFVAGDPSLTAGSADYADYPYRVTVRSTGYAEDPSDATRVAEHMVHAVERLIPRALSAWPADWPKMEGYTVYQTKKETTQLDIPCRLEGKVRLQSRLMVAVNYPTTSSSRTRYLTDLKSMITGGYPDYRPLTGRLYIPTSEQDYLTYFMPLCNALGISYTNSSIDQAGSDWLIPSDLTTYQIYPGGPTYAIPPVGSTLENVSLQPDPLTNPLGVFYRDGDDKLQTNVSVRGALFCKNNVEISGNVQFTPVDMPAVYGSDAPVRLPALTANNLTVKPGSITTIQGLVAVFGEFKVEHSPATDIFSIVGRLVAKKITIDKREPWDGINWSTYYSLFLSSGAPYFPVWMGNQGFNPQPMITVLPDPSTVQYHWNNWSNPIYMPHTNDAGGLRWEILSMGEGPG